MFKLPSYRGETVRGGTTLHYIALSYKDRAVISWTPSSYLTQFHRCCISMADYIYIYIYIVVIVSQKYRSCIIARVYAQTEPYIYIWVYVDTQTPRWITEKCTADKNHFASLKQSIWECWGSRTTNSNSFSTAGVRSRIWVSGATHRRLTPVGSCV